MSDRNSFRRKLIFEVIVVLFIGLAIAPGVMHTVASSKEKIQSNSETVTFFQEFSSPIVEEDGQYVKINVKEADSCITMPNEPRIPVFTKTFEFSCGTKITGIECVCSNVKTMSISKKIEPVSSPQWLENGEIIFEEEGNPVIYDSCEFYPSSWFSYKKGGGINKNGDHVLYLSLHVYPTRYIPAEDVVEYVNSVQITVTYEETESVGFESTNQYDLVIITPSNYSDNLEALVDHKNIYGVKTNLTTIEDIYASYPGRDEAEQIKHFIKYAIEEWGINYVLLVGDIKKIPIRTTYAFMWSSFGNDILSDLYYADIYDENYSFCSWDANDNDRFGEAEYNLSIYPPEANNIDAVDLYPDVHLGRLACRSREEVDIVVDKIITYEKYTYNQIWFKKIILAGGDTFPLSKGGLPFVYEGEITNTKVAQQLPDFKHIKLWSSKRNLNALTFNRAINKGAGFLSYAGHGFELGWGTYRPNAIRKKIGVLQPFYNTLFLQGLRNRYKLPVVFLDACLTAKLDFNISDLDNYYPRLVRLIDIFTGIKYDPTNYFPCFAWCFVSKKNGGAIATIGATRVAYTLVDRNGVYAGAGYLDVHFFKAYEEGVTLGEMFTQTQNDYINNIGKDYFTIEEFLLLGDPSLMVGGYPTHQFIS